MHLATPPPVVRPLVFATDPGAQPRVERTLGGEQVEGGRGSSGRDRFHEEGDAEVTLHEMAGLDGARRGS